MNFISKQQIKEIYARAGRLGIVQRGSHEDGLHSLVEGITGKGRVSGLSFAEAETVISELDARLAAQSTSHVKANTKREKSGGPPSPSGMTTGQQGKAWALMYALADCDSVPSTASLGERVSGIIKKELGVDATARDPFRWLSHQQGKLLIEALKGYVSSAEKKASTG